MKKTIKLSLVCLSLVLSSFQFETVLAEGECQCSIGLGSYWRETYTYWGDEDCDALSPVYYTVTSFGYQLSSGWMSGSICKGRKPT